MVIPTLRASLVLTILLCSITLASPEVANSSVADAEVSLKAAVVMKITKFVTWPAHEREDIRFCIVGDEAILKAMASLRGRTVRKKTIAVLTAPEPELVPEFCDVLYLNNDKTRSSADWLNALSSSAVLTFGESGEFAGDGVIVSMQIRRSKVRFNINLKANEKTGLNISSQLLQLAAKVKLGADS